MPAASRCPRKAGGCGKLRKIPRPAPGRAAAPAPAPGWDPPSEPRRPRLCDGPCPHCGAHQVYADPRGTVRGCIACRRRVIPPGVLAPYRRGAEVTRAARSQRERDDDAKQAVIMAGEFLRRVAAMLADPKVHPRSADLLRWYDEEITDARRERDAGRLAELAGEFTDDQQAGAFRRLHWWQGCPAALPAELDEDPGEDQDDDEDQDDEPVALPARAALALPAARGPAALATPASIARQQQRAQPRPLTWHEAVSACGWRLSPVVGGCQVIDQDGLCGAETVYGIGGAWLCGRHRAGLADMITGAWTAQGRPA